MKNIAIVALLATMASVGALAACGGGSDQPAKSPDNSAAAGSASAAPADSSAAPASSAK
jgi:hypothetical protein